MMFIYADPFGCNSLGIIKNIYELDEINLRVHISSTSTHGVFTFLLWLSFFILSLARFVLSESHTKMGKTSTKQIECCRVRFIRFAIQAIRKCRCNSSAERTSSSSTKQQYITMKASSKKGWNMHSEHLLWVPSVNFCCKQLSCMQNLKRKKTPFI